MMNRYHSSASVDIPTSTVGGVPAKENIYQGEESVPAISIPLLKSTFTKEKNPSLLVFSIPFLQVTLN